eukprot:g3939.t1
MRQKLRALLSAYVITAGSSTHFPKIECLTPPIEQINRTLWLRLLSAFRRIMMQGYGRWAEGAVLHAAATLEFFRLMKEELEKNTRDGSTADAVERNRMLVSMGNQFLGPDIMREITGGEGDSRGGQRRSLTRALVAARRTFVQTLFRLAPFNFTLHVASWGISHMMRGRVPNIRSLVKALTDAIALKLVVATSCFLWTLSGLVCSSHVRHYPTLSLGLTASLIPLPLHLLKNDVVRASFFFLYMPWAVRSALVLSGRSVPQKSAFCVALALTTAIPVSYFSSDWLVSVAFRVVQRAIVKRSRFAGRQTGHAP